MSLPVTPLDELEAVNEMLGSIGQAPVSSLASAAAVGDVGLARTFLAGVVRAIQLHGFAFNTDENYPLTPDIDGFLRVPEGALRVTPSVPTDNLKLRKHPDGFWAIWDAENRTWTHTAPVEFTIVWAYGFDELPAPARHFATVSAARKFQMRLLGSANLDGYGSEDEQNAWVMLMRDERSNRKTNVFRRNATMAAATANRRY